MRTDATDAGSGPDDDGEGPPVELRVDRVMAAIAAFAAPLPITVEVSPFRNAHTDQVQGLVLTDLFADAPGNGVGSAVVRELLRLADEADVSVFTDADGPRSAAFYARMGFERRRSRGHQFEHHPPLPSDDDDMPCAPSPR